MLTFYIGAAWVTAVFMLLGALLLHLLPRTGEWGRKASAAMCSAPWLDALVTYFTVLPWFIAWMGDLGWAGVLGAITGQVVSVMVWTVAHEAFNPEARRGPRIVHSINKSVGRVRNHSAVWWTALAVPLFWFIRMGELLIYPPLTWLVRLPKYDDAEWVSVSRHKFKGLVGHDLIWCLYCDWMTGVWSLGSEMLRNVESFWCPIRFDSEKKCENCRVDFPDIDGGWVASDAGMAEATRVVEARYPPGGTGPERANPWFGHPARLTVEGRPPAPGDSA